MIDDKFYEILNKYCDGNPNEYSILDNIFLRGPSGIPGHFEFLIELEEEFDVELPDSKVFNFTSVGELLVFLREEVNK
jgi:hypothetical protein